MILTYRVYVIYSSNLVIDKPKHLEGAFWVDVKIMALRDFVTWPTWYHSNQTGLTKKLGMIPETISYMMSKIKLRSHGFINFDF